MSTLSIPTVPQTASEWRSVFERIQTQGEDWPLGVLLGTALLHKERELIKRVEEAALQALSEGIVELSPDRKAEIAAAIEKLMVHGEEARRLRAIETVDALSPTAAAPVQHVLPLPDDTVVSRYTKA